MKTCSSGFGPERVLSRWRDDDRVGAGGETARGDRAGVPDPALLRVREGLSVHLCAADRFAVQQERDAGALRSCSQVRCGGVVDIEQQVNGVSLPEHAGGLRREPQRSDVEHIVAVRSARLRGASPRRSSAACWPQCLADNRGSSPGPRRRRDVRCSRRGTRRARCACPVRARRRRSARRRRAGLAAARPSPRVPPCWKGAVRSRSGASIRRRWRCARGPWLRGAVRPCRSGASARPHGRLRSAPARESRRPRRRRRHWRRRAGPSAPP